MQPWDFITLLTTEELKTAQIASNLKKKRKEARHNSNKVIFNCEFFLYNCLPKSIVGLLYKLLYFLWLSSH